MESQVDELAAKGRALSPEERSRLVDLLLESLHEAPLSDVHEAWNAEASRRLQAFDCGELTALDGEDVLAQARRLVS